MNNLETNPTQSLPLERNPKCREKRLVDLFFECTADFAGTIAQKATVFSFEKTKVVPLPARFLLFDFRKIQLRELLFNKSSASKYPYPTASSITRISKIHQAQPIYGSSFVKPNAPAGLSQFRKK